MFGVWGISLAVIYLLAKVRTPQLRALLQFSVPMLLIASLLIIADQYPVVHSSEPAVAQEQTKNNPTTSARSTMTLEDVAASVNADHSVSLDGETIVGMPNEVFGSSTLFLFNNTSENGLRIGFYASDSTSTPRTLPEPGDVPICATSCGRLVGQMGIAKGTMRTYLLALAPGTYSIACIELGDGHRITRCTPIVFTVRDT
jgi:hypothetical protein